MKQNVTIRMALQHVADHPELDTDDLLSIPVHELVARTLFEIANGVRREAPSSLTQANAARKMIFDRLVGRRRSGSHPSTKNIVEVSFADLSGELGP